MMNLYQVFLQSALRHADTICLVDSKQRLTYAESLKIINNIAQMITEHGIDAGDVVAIYADKSIEAVLSYLAILKCGGVALTLDLAFPTEQVLFTLDDAKAKLVLMANVCLDTKLSVPIADVNERASGPITIEGQTASKNNHAAWLVYSSGTTGNPKGITISHQAILSSYHWRYQVSDYKVGERVACHIYLYWEVFRPLLRGATVYLLDDHTLHDFNALTHYIADNKINEILMTPSYAELFWAAARNFDKRCFSSLKRCWLNGEVVGQSLGNRLKKHFNEISFYNLYSISETFDVATSLLNEQHFDDTITSVGKVFPDVAAVILNEETKQPLSSGQVGALYIGGAGLCEGYLNRPDLDEKAFIRKEDSPTGQRLFKTGDKAYIDNEGYLFILGRLDHVVKLRGYNVSLLAIESLMKAHLPIKQCVVKASKEGCIEDSITAYIETDDDQAFCENYALNESGFSQRITEELKQSMPHYMIPTKFILKHFKLNAYSAKLDRKQLGGTGGGSTKDKLEAIWCETLQIDSVKLTDSFYSLGGHSLAAIALLQKLKQTFSIDLTIGELNKVQVFGDLLKRIESGSQEKILPFLSEKIKCIQGEEINCISIDNVSDVLLTGGTGYLGIHLIEALLSDTNINIHCLIRGQGAKERLLKTAKQYKVSLSMQDLRRIKVYSGKADKQNFGLEDSAYQALSSTVGLIIHAAAYVNLLLPYEELRASNVESIYQMAKFATNNKLKPIAYISSDAVFPNIDEMFTEDFINSEVAKHLGDGYGQSKWVAERVLKENPQLCYAIYRLGNLGPSQQAGVSNQHDANLMLLKDIAVTGEVPDTLNLEMTAVDLTAKSLIHSLKTSTYDHKIFNLTSRSIINANELKQTYLAKDLKVISESEWLEALEERNPSLRTLVMQSAFCLTKNYQLRQENAIDISSDFLVNKLAYIKAVLERL